MQPIKGKNYSLGEIFKMADENKTKTILIEYVWYTPCSKCGDLISVLDDEYSVTISTTKENLDVDECIKDFNRFRENYSIYEDYLEENIEAFRYIGFDEADEAEVYYYYTEDRTQVDYCHICDRVFN